MNQVKFSSLLFLLLIPIFLAGQDQDTDIDLVVDYHGQNFSALVQKAAQNIGERNFSAKNIFAFSANKDNTLYSIKIQVEKLSEWKNFLQMQADVRHIEINTLVENRTNIPNDPRVNDQWYLKNIQAFETWMITQGGLNEKGEEVVIAVIDDGFDIQHEDLQDIYYQNLQETSGDGIDNDGNGYVDDFQGYNIKTGNGLITAERHGTNVIGVLGARGNNQTGIAGINWNIKILPIVIPSTSAGVEAALNYIIQMRKLYDATGGEKGAHIVATTYSGGISRRFSTDFPIWCGLYDKLGELGVTSVGATSNNNDNVDVVGDIPSTCESNFLIMVTNSNSRDVKVRDAGYGKIHVDMAVPGENILTTVNNSSKYTYETGTSLSAPILAGAISLLHAVDCKAFQEKYKATPAAAALDLIEIILTSGDNAFYIKSGQNAPLKEITTSGKRLNISKALDSLQNRYGDCIPGLTPPGPLRIKVQTIGNQAYVNYNAPNNDEIHAVIFDLSGRILYKESFMPTGDNNKVWIVDLESNLGKGSGWGLSQVYFVGFIQGKSKAANGFYYFR